jgi:hypothetical protein
MIGICNKMMEIIFNMDLKKHKNINNRLYLIGINYQDYLKMK